MTGAGGRDDCQSAHAAAWSSRAHEQDTGNVNPMNGMSKNAKENLNEGQGGQPSEIQDMPHHPAARAHVQPKPSALPMRLNASEASLNASEASGTGVKCNTAPQTNAPRTATAQGMGASRQGAACMQDAHGSRGQEDRGRASIHTCDRGRASPLDTHPLPPSAALSGLTQHTLQVHRILHVQGKACSILRPHTPHGS
jgi:hypothetical protein